MGRNAIRAMVGIAAVALAAGLAAAGPPRGTGPAVGPHAGRRRPPPAGGPGETHHADPGEGRHRHKLHRGRGGADAGAAGQVRRPTDLPRPRRFAAQAGSGVDGFRGGRKGSIRAPLRLELLPQQRQVHRPGRRPLLAAQHGHVPRPHHRRPAPGHARPEQFRDLGRDLCPRPTQPGHPRADGARRAGGVRAVHLGPRPGQGPRLLHRAGPRRTHLEERGLSEAAGTGAALGGRQCPGG